MISDKFCVLMSVYGRDDPILFKRAVESVFSNTVAPSTLVLVVDGSVPKNIEEVLVFIQHTYSRRIRLCRLSSNVGLASALNFGLSLCCTEWVFRADSDDFNRPDRFALMLDFIRANPRVDILGASIQEVDKSGVALSIRRVPLDHSDILKFLPYRSPFNHMTVGYKRSVVNAFGGYPCVHLKEDYALWIKLLANGAISANLPNILVDATTGDEMYKRRGGLKYVLSEFELQKFFFAHGFKSKSVSIVHGLVRAVVFLSPSFVRKFFYQTFLRRNGNRI